MVIGSVILGGALLSYIYTKDNKGIEVTQENLLIPYEEEIQENIEENDTYSDTEIVVHITGAIQKEGIYSLKINSRIADAIDKAGGLKENADLEEINLAYKLEDGMKIYIPTIEEREKRKREGIENNLEKEQTSTYITKSENKEKINTQGKQGDKININTATQTELETLPGIGPSTALKIIQHRKEKGKFSKIEDIKDVGGIGESKYNQIKDLIKIK